MLLTEYDEEKTLKAIYYEGERAGLDLGIQQTQEQGLCLVLQSAATGDISVAAATKMAAAYGVLDEDDLRKKATARGIRLPD